MGLLAFLAVGFGAFAGALLRWLFGMVLNPLLPTLPLGTLASNLLGGFIIGVTESLGGLFLGENLGRIGIFVIFIAILLFRPTGLFGQRA